MRFGPEHNLLIDGGLPSGRYVYIVEGDECWLSARLATAPARGRVGAWRASVHAGASRARTDLTHARPRFSILQSKTPELENQLGRML